MNQDATLDRRYAGILDGLGLLRESTRTTRVFGANGHRFRLNPPIKEAALLAFETEHRVRLPEEYGGFLLHVGDGGAGPAYGVFRLGEMDDGHGYTRWKENNGFVGVLSVPFPHNGPWNDLNGKPEFDESRETDYDYEYEDGYGKQLSEWETSHYWNTCHINGAIPICHLGCACRQWLIVTGTEAGHVWCDDRVDQKGLRPLETASTCRASFLNWYCSWLDDALRTASPQ